LISRLKIIFAVIIYVSCGLSVEFCGVLRFSGIPIDSVQLVMGTFLNATQNTLRYILLLRVTILRV